MSIAECVYRRAIFIFINLRLINNVYLKFLKIKL